MTKRVRIENADTSDYKVLVQVWEKGRDGQPDDLIREIRLDYPTAMTADMGPNECLLTSTRYILVKEV